MKIIRPFVVNTATVNSDVPAPAIASNAWNSGTTYGSLVDRVAVFSGTNVTWYQNLQVPNLNHAPASSPTWWRKVADGYKLWDNATTYSSGQRVEAPTTPGGVALRAYESLQNSNLNHAVTDPAWWVDVGPSNRWAMFDQVNGTKTIVRDTMTVSFQGIGFPVQGFTGTGRVDSIALLNVTAASARIISTDAITFATIYDQTFSLIDGGGITDWYAYFYEDARYLRDLIVLDLPPAPTPNITIMLTNTGGEVSVGTVIVGQQRDLGATQYGASIGITDYSKKEADEFGSYSIVERAYSKRGRFTVWTDNERVPALIDLATQYRATPVVWVGADSMAFTALYGFYKDFNVEIAYPTMSICTLDIEGLT